MSNNAIIAISQQLSKSLRKLFIKSIGKDVKSTTISEILSQCRGIEELNISHNENVTDNTFSSLPILQNDFPNLKKMDVSFCNITSIGLANLAKYYVNLNILNISGSNHVGDAALSVICDTCKLLRVFYANDCISITDKGIHHLCSSCVYLQILHLSVSENNEAKPTNELFHQYTDKLLKYILSKGKQVIELVLCNQPGITFTLKWLYKQRFFNCHPLQKLDLRGCFNISPEYLSKVFSSLMHLTNVILPEKFFNTFVSTKSFWNESFSHLVYVQQFNENDYNEEYKTFKKTKEVHIDTKKKSLFESISTKKVIKDVATEKNLSGCYILKQLPNIRRLQYHDQYTRLRLKENYCVTRIQMVWRLHHFWRRFCHKVMARRIANTYKIILTRRKFQKQLYHFVSNRAARVIQKFLYEKNFTYVRAARKIQFCYKSYQLRKHKIQLIYKNQIIIKIQKFVRGFLVRISERYILSRIYVKMPSIWKDFMKFEPKFDTKMSRFKRKENTSLFQITELRTDTTSMLNHILNDVVTTKGVLPPKIPYVIPQPFDKKPYVSLLNGQKMSYFSHKNSLFSSEFVKKTNGNEQMPVHIFNIKFWPLTDVPDTGDPSIEEHDPSLNNFELVQNSRTTLFCETCQTRLRVINCKTCLKGYCFYCAFRIHYVAFKRDHAISIIQPRVFKEKEVSKSLVYNIDMAQNVSVLIINLKK